MADVNGDSSASAVCSERVEKESPAPTSNNEQHQASNPEPPKARYDWYQTMSDVYLNVMIKKLASKDVQVEYGERSVSCDINLPSGSTYVLDLQLAHGIVPDKCTTKVMSTKVELKMRKEEGIQWTKLEGDGNEPTFKQPQVSEGDSAAAATGSSGSSTATSVRKYPTSSHMQHDWDKLAATIKKEEQEEKLEGDAALQQLFQKIYSDGSDEVKKAMAKSFSESGGTVLSTNWKEVGDNKVEMKPPDGMEWKAYPKS